MVTSLKKIWADGIYKLDGFSIGFARPLISFWKSLNDHPVKLAFRSYPAVGWLSVPLPGGDAIDA
jgi:hypothetical protein